MFFSTKDGEESPRQGKASLLLLIGVALIGILLIVFGGQIGKSEKKEASAEPPGAVGAQEELEAYQSYIEDRVKSLCESVKGVENVTVAVTLSGGFEEIYAKEISNEKESYVILGSGSNASALYLSRKAPEITGIGVVCRGGGNDNVRQELLSLLSAAFKVPANRIYITESKF
jgi:stage III sporulation protein AG